MALDLSPAGPGGGGRDTSSQVRDSIIDTVFKISWNIFILINLYLCV